MDMPSCRKPTLHHCGQAHRAAPLHLLPGVFQRCPLGPHGREYDLPVVLQLLGGILQCIPVLLLLELVSRLCPQKRPHAREESKRPRNTNTSMRTCSISFSRQRPPLPPRCGEHQDLGNDGSGNNDLTSLIDHLILPQIATKQPSTSMSENLSSINLQQFLAIICILCISSGRFYGGSKENPCARTKPLRPFGSSRIALGMHMHPTRSGAT